MLGDEGSQPTSGEMDIMEQADHGSTAILALIHNRSTAGPSGDGALIDVPDACTVVQGYLLT